MLMKWTVQRYVLREVVQTWLAVTGVLVAILVSNQLSRVLGQAADNQYGRHVVFDLIALGAIMNLSIIVPVGLLLAIVLTLGRMYHDSEMAALQACGFGPARLLVPLFCFAVGDRRRPRMAVVRSGAAGRRPGAAAASIGAEGRAIRSARCRPFPLVHAAATRCSTPSASIARACCTTCSCSAKSAGRIEVALADTATYSQAAADGMHLVTLFNGRRYEGVPGRRDFRVIEFREHGIPIATPGDASSGTQDPDTKPTPRAARLHRALRHRAIAIQGIDAASWRWC